MVNITSDELLAIVGRLYTEGVLLRAKVAELQAQVDSILKERETKPL